MNSSGDTETRTITALGLEGSANKLGVGIVRHTYRANDIDEWRAENPGEPIAVDVLANVRDTYNSTSGTRVFATRHGDASPGSGI